MLPYLENEKRVSDTPSAIKREPDHESDQDYDMLESAAEDLIKAVHSKNVKDVTAALKAAFEICDSQPHEEGPHE